MDAGWPSAADKMPTVTLNRNVFEKLVGKRLPDKELMDRISYLGTDLQKVDKDNIEVEVFPNRPDWLSEQGFARAFSSFIGVKTGFRKYDVRPFGSKLVVKDLPSQWPYAVACVVKGLKIDDEKIREIIQLQEKLGLTLTRKRRKGGIGLYPADKIKFPIRFTGLEPDKIEFRPLDFQEAMKAKRILSVHPKGREYGHIMEGWKKYPVFTDANGTIMSMPPIINSDDVGKIDEKTKDVFVEGTGPDLNILKTCLNIIATSLADMGGQIYSLDIVYPDQRFKFPDLSPRNMKIDRKYINKWLGLSLNEKEFKKYLERMGYGYVPGKGAVLVPRYRADVMHQVDLAEDIAVAYGYENFEETIPRVATIGEESAMEKFRRKISDIMVGLGFLELNTYHLMNSDDLTRKMKTEMDCVKISNSASNEYDTLRLWMTPALMKILSENTQRELPQMIFESGVVFKKNSKIDTGVEELVRLCALISDNGSDFTRAKQVLDYLMKALDLEYTTEDVEHPSFIAGRVGRVSVAGKKVAYIGEIHPQVLQNWGIETPVAGFELNLTELFPLIKS